MTAADVQERLSAIAGEVDRARRLLVSPAPGNLDESAAILQGASASFAAIPPSLAAAAPEQARRFRFAVQHAATLLQYAAEFHENWRRIRGAMISGYQPGGSAADAELPARLCLRG